MLTSDSHPGATSDNDWYRYLYLYDDEHRASNEPIDPSCDGPCCSRYSRAYLHHLFKTGEALGQRLATLHNLRFYTRLIEHLETA